MFYPNAGPVIWVFADKWIQYAAGLRSPFLTEAKIFVLPNPKICTVPYENLDAIRTDCWESAIVQQSK